MARLSLKLILPVTLVALGLPTAASARKNAWQLVALSGTYAYHATNTAPAACDPNETNNGDGIVLSRDYTETFHADSFPSYQYAAKYFPSLGGPQTNGPGQKAHLIRQGTSNETYRIFNVNYSAGTCTPQDQTCTKATTMTTARFLFGVTHRNFRPNGRLQTFWNLDLAAAIPDCTPKSADTLQHGLMPFSANDIPSDFKARAGKRQFTRKRATFSIHGTATVPKTSGYTATITYSARATLKKVVISDGCVDQHPQHAFVCTN